MSEPVTLLKAGRNEQYVLCEACNRYVRGGLSLRGWCGACEAEFRKLEKKTPRGGEPTGRLVQVRT